MILPPDQIDIRNCEAKDEVPLAILLSNNFPDAPDAEAIHKTWLWQFRNAFSRNSGIAVAQKGEDIVAQYAVMWFPMSCQGKAIEGAISTATVTDKSVRRKGLFTRLALKVYQDISAEGAKIVYGFPNSQSIKGFINSLDWFRVTSFPAYIKPIDLSAFTMKIIGRNAFSRMTGGAGNLFFRLIIRILRRRDRTSALTLKRVREIPDGIDTLWATTAIAEKIALIRDRNYLSWRYLKKPFFIYNIYIAVSKNENPRGYVITHTAEKFGMKILFVMELVAEKDDPAVCSVLLDELNHIAQREGCSAISCLVTPDDHNRSMYIREGFFPVPQFLFPQDIFWCAKVISPDVDRVYVRDKKNWYISWGDLDVV
jgi:hypothetical protein